MAEKDELVRFGVSFPTTLIEQFDTYIEKLGYKNRSEAIRDMARKSLLDSNLLQAEKQVAGTIVMVYDHHISELPLVLTELQHEFHQDIISTMHIHLSHSQCLEIIVVRGVMGRLRSLQQSIQVLRGVHYAELSVTYIEEHDHPQHDHSNHNPAHHDHPHHDDRP